MAVVYVYLAPALAPVLWVWFSRQKSFSFQPSINVITEKVRFVLRTNAGLILPIKKQSKPQLLSQ